MPHRNMFPEYALPWKRAHSWIPTPATKLQHGPEQTADEAFAGTRTAGREPASPGSHSS